MILLWLILPEWSDIIFPPHVFSGVLVPLVVVGFPDEVGLAIIVPLLGGGGFWILTPTWEMLQFDEHIFQLSWNHQLVYILLFFVVQIYFIGSVQMYDPPWTDNV